MYTLYTTPHLTTNLFNNLVAGLEFSHYMRNVCAYYISQFQQYAYLNIFVVTHGEHKHECVYDHMHLLLGGFCLFVFELGSHSLCCTNWSAVFGLKESLSPPE